jgi:hypothetical protein
MGRLPSAYPLRAGGRGGGRWPLHVASGATFRQIRRVAGSRRPPATSCLHCSLARAVEAEWRGGAVGPVVRIGRSEPLWLPVSGARVYRTLRELLRSVRADAADSLKLAVLDLPGKSHVEVMATIARAGGRARSVSVRLPRYEATRLAGGFAESAG